MDLTLFRMDFPTYQDWGVFTDNETNYINKHLPKNLAEFLIGEGKRSYNNGLLWTVFPEDYHAILKNWGLGGDRFVFIRSSFGNLLYFYKEKYYILNPQTGENYLFGATLSIILNGIIGMDITLEEGFYQIQHKKLIEKNTELKADEMLTFVPALPLGGNEDTSEIEVVKMKEELDNLAQLYNHQTTD